MDFASGSSTAAGRWRFEHNSDGGVIGGLPHPGAWKVTVAAMFMEGISDWGWIRGDLVRIPLRTDQPLTIESLGK